jgi:Family of unknown function (DUF6192)
MNQEVARHLDRAEKYLARGDEFYGKAADEMIAAKAADPALSNRAMGERFGKSARWVGALIGWRERGEPDAPIDWGRGSHATSAEIDEGVVKMLRDGPMERVEQIVSSLPANRVAKVAHAALGRPGVAREMAKDPDAAAAVVRASAHVGEEQAHREDRRHREHSQTRPTMDLLVKVLGNLMVAKRATKSAYEAARELSLTDEQREAVHEALDEEATIIDWFRSYLDSGDQSFEAELERLLTD